MTLLGLVLTAAAARARLARASVAYYARPTARGWIAYSEACRASCAADEAAWLEWHRRQVVPDVPPVGEEATA